MLTLDAEVARLILESLRAAADAQGATLFCWCLMPDHLHFVAAIQPGGSDVAVLVRSFGSRVTKRTKHLRPPPVFQRSFYDSVVRGTEDLTGRCSYVVNNPVRKGLTTDWREYPYAWLSSEVGT